MKTIIIFHPSYYFGGVSVLYSRLYVELSSSKICKVKVIDYKDGFIGSKILANQISEQFISFPNCDKDSIDALKTTEDYVVLMSSTQIHRAKSFFSKYGINPTVLVGVYHPFEASVEFIFKARRLLSFFDYRLIKYYQYLFPLSKNRTLSFVEQGVSLNGLYFMDMACYNATSYFLNLKSDYDRKVKLIPVPVPVKNNPAKQIDKSQSLSFGYIGRVEDFKTMPLIEFISALSELNLDKIKMYIIGDGRDLSFLKQLVKSNYNNVDITFLGALSNEKSQEIFKNYVDIAACMGTAALDTASLGLPTIVLNPLEKKVENYRYNWLHLNKNFILGDYADAPWFLNDGKTVRELIEEASNSYLEMSLESINYVKNNHSVEVVSQSIVDSANKSSFKLSDISFNKIKKLQ